MQFPKKYTIQLTGGTDVKYSPTIDYVRYVLKEAYSKIGIFFDINIIKRGFYPHGNGIVNINIQKSNILKPIDFCNFKEINPTIQVL